MITNDPANNDPVCFLSKRHSIHTGKRSTALCVEFQILFINNAVILQKKKNEKEKGWVLKC